MGYQINEIVIFKGDEYKINSDAFELYGAMWHTAVDSNDNEITVPTKKEKEKQAKQIQSDWKKQQNQFSKLNNKV